MKTATSVPLGFIQEFHQLQIIIGDHSDDYYALRKQVSGLWKDAKVVEEEDLEDCVTGQVSRNEACWENKLLQFLNETLHKSRSRYLPNGEAGKDIVIKIIDLEVRAGSLHINASLVSNLYHGFDQYDALRRAYDFFVGETERLFTSVVPTKKVAVQFKNVTPHQKGKLNTSFLKSLTSLRFFWNVSGASIAFLEKSYPDYNKYKNLGAAILFTGTFAFLSGCFALSYLTDNWWIRIPIGLLWGLTIINIDMMIVNTMVKYEKFHISSVVGVISRLLLGVAIAFALSVPVEMTLLNDEIRDEIDRYDRVNTEIAVDEATKEFERIDELKQLKVEKEALFNAEMQGKETASGRRGYGQIAQKIEGQINELTTEIEALEQRRDSTEAQLRREITTQTEQNNKYGFLASYRAFHRLQYESADDSVFYISWGIRLLILMVELLPIISKLLMRRGAYDSTCELEEYKLMRMNDRIRKQIP